MLRMRCISKLKLGGQRRCVDFLQLPGEICRHNQTTELVTITMRKMRALRDAIPIMELLKEMRGLNFPMESSQAKVRCRVFEENLGALEMARVNKYRPQTKHLNVRLHHFRDDVKRKEISIHAINTNDQPADFLTNALNEDTLKRHRLKSWVGRYQSQPE